MATRTKGLILGLNCTRDWSITNTFGRVFTVEEAKAAWEGGHVEDYNMAFWRLVQHNWDLDAVKAYFAEMDAADRARKAAKQS
jgi:hypothetical protein